MARTYLKCSAKARETQYGQIIKLGIKVDDFIEFARKHVNERGYINLDIMPRKEVGQYGDSHSVALDDFVKGSGQRATTTTLDQHSAPVTADDIPFAWALPFVLPALLSLHVVLS